MKLFYILGFTKALVSGSSISATRLICFPVFLDVSRFFKEQTGIVCHAFDA